jgi:hypothetical protein
VPVRGDYDIGGDFNPKFKWWLVEVYANDATWNPVNIYVHGRGVSIDSFDASPSEVQAGGGISVSWTTDLAGGGVRLSWSGPVSCPGSSGGEVRYSDIITCAAQSPGAASFTLKAEGPPADRSPYIVSQSREVNIVGRSADYVDLNFIVKDTCNSAPVSGAEVRISRDFGNGVSRRTDGGGFANFGVTRDTEVGWSVSRPGYNDARGSVNSDGGVGTVISLQRDCSAPPPGGGGEEGPSHNECRNEACVIVPGSGPDACQTDSDCRAIPGLSYGCDWDYGVCRQMEGGPYATPECDNQCPQGPALNYRCIDNTCYQADDGPYKGLKSCLEACAGAPPPPPPPPSYYNTCATDGSCARIRGYGPNECSDPGNPDSSDCAQPPPYCTSFTSTPTKLVYPPAKGATLSWTCAKAHFGCVITDNNPDAPDIGNVPASGSRLTPPLSKTTDYVLQCQGKGGSSPQYHLPLGTLRVYQMGGGKIQEVNPQSR